MMARWPASNRAGSLAPALLLAILAFVAVSVATLLIERPSSPVLEEQPAEPLVVQPVEVVSEQPQAVDVMLGWGTAPTVLWPGAEGTITAILVAPGDSISSGSVLAMSDGTKVFALATRRPLYRDLSVGVTGEDVRDLAEELNHLGLLPAEHVSDRFDRRIRSAVSELNARAGREASDLAVATVAWLPSDPFTIAALSVTPGELSPPRGAVFLTGPTPLDSAQVSAPEGSARGLRPVDGDSVVSVGEDEFAVEADMSVASSDLGALAQVVEPSLSRVTGAVLRLREPVQAMQVPASAVTTGADGRTCVIDPGGTAHVVSIVGGGPGRVELAGSVPAQVVANPVAAMRGTTCGSPDASTDR